MSGDSCQYPGYEQIYDDLSTLISTYPPPFIYIHDFDALRTTFAVVNTLLQELSEGPGPFKICYARVDSVACFTQRLFYETVINTLARWEPSWEDGCANWSSNDEMRWNENMHAFLHGLRAVHESLRQKHGIVTTKGKEKQWNSDYENVRIVIVVERPERLKEGLPELLVPLTRLAELAWVELSVIFISQVAWEDIRPPLGASPDPYYIDVPSPLKENIVKMLLLNFNQLAQSSSDIFSNPYHPSLKSLYTHFITMLCDICFPFVHDPQEIQYVAAARWPGFVKPVLDEHKRKIAEHKAQIQEDDIDMDMDDPGHGEEIPFMPPTEDVRVRLSRMFNSSFTTALETLYPRLTNATDWALTNMPEDNLLSKPVGQANAQAHLNMGMSEDFDGMQSLPRMSKFILVASFLSSTNPPKSDIRMFGRGLDEKKRRRRAMKAPKRTKGGGPAKVSQRLLGPMPFAFDRMIAILGALLEENDVETRLHAPEFQIPGEHTDMEISRIGIYSSVVELTSMRLMHKTSPPDRLDGPPMFKCAISYEGTLALAKQLKIPLDDLLWDPV